MRSAPWPALVSLLLALLASPAAAHQRTAYWAPEAGAVEVHVAVGVSTRVRLEGFPELRSIEVTEGLPTLELLPSGGTSLLITPPSDFAVGERALVTVKLGPPDLALTLLLVSRKDAVDGEVRIVRLRAPAPEELNVETVARFLSATSEDRVSLAVEKPVLQGPKVRVQLESVLRLDSHLFVTLELLSIGRCDKPWKLERLRLHFVQEDGAQMELPLLLVSSPPKRCHQHYTLIAMLPEHSPRLLLSVEGQGAPEGIFPLPSGGEEASP